MKVMEPSMYGALYEQHEWPPFQHAMPVMSKGPNAKFPPCSLMFVRRLETMPVIKMSFMSGIVPPSGLVAMMRPAHNSHQARIRLESHDDAISVGFLYRRPRDTRLLNAPTSSAQILQPFTGLGKVLGCKLYRQCIVLRKISRDTHRPLSNTTALPPPGRPAPRCPPP